MCYSHRWKPVAILSVLSTLLSLAAISLFIEAFIFFYKPTIITFEMGSELT